MLAVLTALPCETRPLVDHFGLDRQATQARFPIYEGPEIRLVQSGVGVQRAQAAVAELATQLEGRPSAWLNVGVGGAPHRPRGDCVLAHKVVQRGTQQRWYPPVLAPQLCATDVVITVAAAENNYPEDVVYDMEAAGFCAAACQHAPVDLVQIFKIVSDGPQYSSRNVTAEQVEQLIRDRLELITTLAGDLETRGATLARRSAVPDEVLECIQHWHFSATQRIQLARLLKRRQVLTQGDRFTSQSIQAATSSAQLLRALTQEVEELGLHWLDSTKR